MTMTVLYFTCVVLVMIEYVENSPVTSTKQTGTFGKHTKTNTSLGGPESKSGQREKRDIIEWPLYDMDLHYVGIFLADHKYFEFDRRYEMDYEKAERPYHKHFPLPRLRVPHPDVESRCQRGIMDCIKQIASVANQSSSIHKLAHKTPAPANRIRAYPLADHLELYRYRVTAAYFMCWFTMMREPILRFFMDGKNCLTGLEKTQDAYYAKRKVVDWRIDSRDKPFQCAEILFCPDPCYGKKSSGNVPSPRAMEQDNGNPCFLVKDRTCKWVAEENESYDDLIRNRMNYTCNCESQQKGFKWYTKYTMCIDIDECYEKRFKCGSGTVCQNTVGGYICVCKRDERYNFETEECEPFIPLPEATFRGRLKHHRRPQVVWWRYLEILLGISSSSCLRITELTIFTLNILVMVVIQ